MTFDLLLRGLVILLLIVRIIYWQVTERQADNKKPKTVKPSLRSRVKKIPLTVIWVVLIAQLLGMQILPFETNRTMQLCGFILAVIGTACSMIARKELGLNWAHAAEYQIKKENELITTGIYKYIRHPIYTGMLFFVIGAELVVGSYLSLIFLIIFPFIMYRQARNEEKILSAHFDTKYRAYMGRSKMFIPYIW